MHKVSVRIDFKAKRNPLTAVAFVDGVGDAGLAGVGGGEARVLDVAAVLADGQRRGRVVQEHAAHAEAEVAGIQK